MIKAERDHFPPISILSKFCCEPQEALSLLRAAGPTARAISRQKEENAISHAYGASGSVSSRPQPSMRLFDDHRPDIAASVGKASREAFDAVLQVFDNLQVAGSVTLQSFQQHVLRAPPRNLRGGFSLDKRAVVPHNAKFKVKPAFGLRHCEARLQNPSRMSAQDILSAWRC